MTIFIALDVALFYFNLIMAVCASEFARRVAADERACPYQDIKKRYARVRRRAVLTIFLFMAANAPVVASVLWRFAYE